MVLFADAVLHLMCTCHILSMPRGNMLLLCVGSSGDIKYMFIKSDARLDYPQPQGIFVTSVQGAAPCDGHQRTCRT